MDDHLINLRRRSVEDGNGNVGTNLKYRKEIKAYCHWVDENRARLGLPANRHENETAIHAYWNEKMLNRRSCKGETAKQTRHHIGFYKIFLSHFKVRAKLLFRDITSVHRTYVNQS